MPCNGPTVTPAAKAASAASATARACCGAHCEYAWSRSPKRSWQAMAASINSRALARFSRKSRAISISGRNSRSLGMIISSRVPDATGLGLAFSTEGNAFDFDAVAVAELQCAGRPCRRIDRKEFAPYPVHLVVIPSVGEHDGHLDDTLEARAG